MMDKLFRPSKKLGTYLYSIYLNVASVRELEEDIILKNTYWILASRSDDTCVDFDIWFDEDLGVTANPKIIASLVYNADTGETVYECENLAGMF